MARKQVSVVLTEKKTRKEASASLIARFALENRSELFPSHFNELMSLACWKFTEATAKYRTRYMTRAAMRPAAKQHHEHVIPRLTLRLAMVKHPDEAETILKLAVACVVTPEEHRLLHRDAFGWHRYQAVDLDVVDTETGRPADIESLAYKLDESWNRLVGSFS